MGYRGKLTAFSPSQSSHTILSVSHRCNFFRVKMHQNAPQSHPLNLLKTNKVIIIYLKHPFSLERFFSISHLDYSKILLKEPLQLLYHSLLFLLSVAATEAGHCWEYLVNIGSRCSYRSITESIRHKLVGLVRFQVLTCDNLIQVVLLTLLFICLPLEQKNWNFHALPPALSSLFSMWRLPAIIRVWSRSQKDTALVYQD